AGGETVRRDRAAAPLGTIDLDQQGGEPRLARPLARSHRRAPGVPRDLHVAPALQPARSRLSSYTSPNAARVRFSCPVRVTTTLSSMRMPPYLRNESVFAQSMYLAFSLFFSSASSRSMK